MTPFPPARIRQVREKVAIAQTLLDDLDDALREIERLQADLTAVAADLRQSERLRAKGGQLGQ